MGRLIVDENKCKRDGICASECPMAILSSSAAREALGLPEGHPYHYPMMVGYPKTKYFRLPRRKTPRITWS